MADVSGFLAVDCPDLSPYPRARHDSFVIGFDGSAFIQDLARLYGSCAWGTFECAGFLDRSVNLRTVATYSFDGDDVATPFFRRCT
jgi:hypothetical protein